MGVQGCDSHLWDSCTDFYQASLDVNKNKTLEDRPKFFNFKFDEAETEKDLKIAKKLHDHNLDKAGQRTNLHRCHPKPFDEKLRKKKKFKKPSNPAPMLGRETFNDLMVKVERDSSYKKVVDNLGELQKDDLCRGKEIRPMEEVGKFKCFYGHNGSPWLYLGPFKIEENSLDPYHVTIHDLFYHHECDNVTQFLGPLLDFPPGRMNARTKKNDWTMKK